MRIPTSQKWFTEGSSRKLPRTNKNLIIETRIPFKPEFFSGFLFAASFKVVYITAMVSHLSYVFLDVERRVRKPSGKTGKQSSHFSLEEEETRTSKRKRKRKRRKKES